MSSDAVVACRGLSKTYVTSSGGIEALHSVDADFAAEQVTAIVGASGSGKSTLLRAVAGLDRPTGGSVLAAGRELTEAAARELRRHRAEVVTYVSQKPADNFIPHLTLAEHATDEPETARRLLADVGLAHRLDSLPIELSGGEQARAAFALAVGRGTPLVVVDEPTAELDGESAHLLLEAVRSYAAAGVAFVIATHDPDVTAIADSVLRLERGRVVTEADAIPAERRRARRSLAGRAGRDGGASSHEDRSLTAAATCTRCQTSRSGCGAASSASSSAGRAPASRRCSRCSPAGSSLTPVRSCRSGAGGLDMVGARLPAAAVRARPRADRTRERRAPGPPRRPPRGARRAHRRAPSRASGLDELAGRRPPETSIGQQQRTALARALVLRPTVLIADEPSSHQDAGWHDAVWALLARAANEGTACLAATHEPEAATYATSVWEIAEGVLAAPR